MGAGGAHVLERRKSAFFAPITVLLRIWQRTHHRALPGTHLPCRYLTALSCNESVCSKPCRPPSLFTGQPLAVRSGVNFDWFFTRRGAIYLLETTATVFLKWVDMFAKEFHAHMLPGKFKTPSAGGRVWHLSHHREVFHMVSPFCPEGVF